MLVHNHNPMEQYSQYALAYNLLYFSAYTSILLSYTRHNQKSPNIKTELYYLPPKTTQTIPLETLPNRKWQLDCF